MLQKVISLDCGIRQLAQARDEVSSIRGVVAAELMAGRRAIRVWQGEEVSEAALRGALHACGIRNAQID